jgi:DNA-binding NarL/FixJ family response regulator
MQDYSTKLAVEQRLGHDTALPAALSSRQQQIAAMLCGHYSIKRIAGELCVSENTVKKHIQNIKKALEIDKSGADFIYVLKQMEVFPSSVKLSAQ